MSAGPFPLGRPARSAPPLPAPEPFAHRGPIDEQAIEAIARRNRDRLAEAKRRMGVLYAHHPDNHAARVVQRTRAWSRL